MLEFEQRKQSFLSGLSDIFSLQGEVERFTDLLLKYGPKKLWEDRVRHSKFIRYVVTPSHYPDEDPKETGPEHEHLLIAEGDDRFELFKGMNGMDNMVDVPRGCHDPKTGKIDPSKARVYITRDLQTRKLTATVWIDQEALPGSGT